MANKKCGYCRREGHNMSKCPTRLGQVDRIKSHVIGQRKLAHDLLIMNGYGAGALVEVPDWWTGNKYTCIIPSLAFFGEYSNQHSYVEYQNVKYSKKVYSTLLHLEHRYNEGENLDGVIRHRHFPRIVVPCHPLDDMSATVMANIYVSTLEYPPDGVIKRDARGTYYGSNGPAILLAPSHETDAKEADFRAKITNHYRLNNGSGNWMPD